MPGIFQDPAGAALGDADFEVASFAAGEDADAGAEVRFKIETGRFLKEGVERCGLEEAVELEMANAVLPRRYLVRGGHDVKPALIKDDGVGLDFSLLRV